MKASAVMTFEGQAFMLFVFLFIMLLGFEAIMQIKKFRNRERLQFIFMLLIVFYHVRELGEIMKINHTSCKEN